MAFIVGLEKSVPMSAQGTIDSGQSEWNRLGSLNNFHHTGKCVQ
jgi:hypothetical protein